MRLSVNGQEREVDVEPDVPLLFVLRNDLGLMSPKLGCGLEQCGACRVLIDGEAHPSCRIPVESVVGKAVVTLEGIGSEAQPHPLQRAFLQENAGQCGYCLSGILISAKALLDRVARPSHDEICAALASNLCRCGSHPRFLRAIARAAADMEREQDG